MTIEALVWSVLVVAMVAAMVWPTWRIQRERSRRRSLEETKRRLLEGDGLAGWARRVGLEVEEVRGEVWRGWRAYRGVDVEVELDVGSVGQIDDIMGQGGRAARVRMRLGGRVPAGVSLTKHSVLVSHGAVRAPVVGRDEALGLFHVEGDASTSRLLGRTGVPQALHALWALEPTGRLELSGGVVTFELVSALDVVEGEGDARGHELMARCEAVVDATPEAFDVERARAGALRDEGEEARWRWSMGKALFEREQQGEVFEELAAAFDGLDPLAKAACACWGKYPLFELAPEERHGALSAVAAAEYVGEDVSGALSARVGWLALFDTTLDPKTRVEAARRAPKAREAPRDASERDARLVALLTEGEPAPGLDRGEVLRALGRGGWEPGREATKALAEGGDDLVRAQLLELIMRRGASAEDAEALSLLAEAKVGDARAALVRLRSGEGAGRLSLSEEDGARGGLTQADEPGGLTQAEDPCSS